MRLIFNSMKYNTPHTTLWLVARADEGNLIKLPEAENNKNKKKYHCVGNITCTERVSKFL